MRLAASAVVFVIAAASLQARQSTDLAAVLSEMRTALGGEQALQSIRSLAVSGAEERSTSGGGGRLSSRIEVACILPDQCIKARRVPMSAGDTLVTLGFNGSALINRRESNIAYQLDASAGQSGREPSLVASLRREFARLLVPLIGLSVLDPVTMTYEGRREFDGKTSDVISLRTPDGFEGKLFIDATTHRPAGVSWMAVPPVVITGTGSMRGVIRRPDDLAKVEHRILYSEFIAQDGFTLPHRFKQVSGPVTIDLRLGAYRINPQLDPAWFDPSR